MVVVLLLLLMLLLVLRALARARARCVSRGRRLLALAFELEGGARQSMALVRANFCAEAMRARSYLR
jgi:hypothetical protein